MLKTACHCHNIILTVSVLPTDITSCNCSICHRLGAYWAYYDTSDVMVTSGDYPLENYSWGEKSIIYHRCGGCGCTTHYTTGDTADEPHLTAINCRMAAPADLAEIPIRLFDGRTSWQYLAE